MTAPTIPVRLGDFAAILDKTAAIDGRLDRIEALVLASDRLVAAVRAWRDAGGHPMVPLSSRAGSPIASAEWGILAALSDYEAAVAGDDDRGAEHG
jgi:hypothetical protein